MEENLQLSFLASLNLPDLRNLTNDEIMHDQNWLAIHTKLSSGIPKFEGR